MGITNVPCQSSLSQKQIKLDSITDLEEVNKNIRYTTHPILKVQKSTKTKVASAILSLDINMEYYNIIQYQITEVSRTINLWKKYIECPPDK
jgi:hypothetical protein